MQPTTQFLSTGPSAAAVRWLLTAAAFVAVAVAGVITGTTLFALCAAMLVYGALETRAAFLVLRAIGEQAKACGRDFLALQRLAPQDVPRTIFPGDASLLGRHVVALKAMADRHGRHRQGYLLDALESSPNAATARIGVAASVMAALGLLGTLVGLTCMADDFVAALGATDAASMNDALRRSLDGMTTAYVTTLIGTFVGSLVLRGLDAIADTAIDRLVRQIGAQCEYLLFDPDEQQVREAA